VEYPSVSGLDGGGNAVCSNYGITGYPTMILIAPNQDIVEQDMWPITTQNINDILESYSLTQQICMTGLEADFEGVPTTIDAGNSVDFTDLSTGGIPTIWNWTFYGANTTSSAVQNPANIVYNTAGSYDVRLIVSDGLVIDTLVKPGYITVNPPTTLWSDFTASATTILEGETIDFFDQSLNGPPTSWTWSFSGAETTSSAIQDPIGIQYLTAGTYDVTLAISDGTNNHSTTKIDYITVVDSNQVPVADFTSNFTTIMVGGSVDYYDLTLGGPTSWSWEFQGADVTTSVIQNPTAIIYSNIGVYPVTLIATNFLTSDTLTKIDYINVIDNSFFDTLWTDFRATTSRLIEQGGSVSFEDLTVGYPTNWTWNFEGGTPLTSNDQHPIDILYTTAGSYDVQLIVTNGMFSDTLIKGDFIIVTDGLWQDPDGFCDTISNLTSNDIPLTFRHLTPGRWGYFPGHNGYTVKAYAEKITNYTFSNVQGMLVPVIKAYSASSSAKVKFTVWDMDTTGYPGNEIETIDVQIGDFTPYLYHSILFDNPAPVNGTFFVGFQLFYSTPADTFAVYMAPNRGIGGHNTMYVKRSSDWMSPSELLGDTLNTALGIDLIGCLVKVEEIDLEESINIYPNPSSDIVYIDFLNEIKSNVKISVFDLYGRQITSLDNINDSYLIDFKYHDAGIYFVVIETDKQTVIKKLIIIK